ncbi:MAG: phosphotransferase [Actinotalea sp.]|nr:phosphotransferase [Actinotalea sp.]
MTPTTTTDRPLTGRTPTDDGVMAVLEAWLPGRRWFPAKGTEGTVDRVAVVDLEDPQGQGRVGLHLLRLPSGALLQVPLVLRRDEAGLPEAARDAVVGRTTDGTLVVDGPHDPAFVRAWLAAAERPGAAADAQEADVAGMRVLSGEQSNTSVLLPALDPPAILKVFRGVSTGPNPDVEVPLGLNEAGWRGAPRPLAWLTGAWPAAAAGPAEVGHLGVLSELVQDAQDGFELACRHAGQGESFGSLAVDLGRTTAQMHAALRRALPTGGAANAEPAAVVAVLRARAAAAVAAAPVLAERASAVEAVLAEVERLPQLPPLQRVHGDYHLGQVLHSADRGWSVLDFEGEPSASEAERNRPDLALRDLAGMLRSVDYAAAVGGAPGPGWAQEAREQLVAGYLAEAGATGAVDATTTAALLRVLELDKALYEVVYESRNRPTWVLIPLDGVDRLLVREG